MTTLHNTTKEEIKRSLRGKSIASLKALLEFNTKFKQVASLRVEVIQEILDEISPQSQTDFKLRQSND